MKSVYRALAASLLVVSLVLFTVALALAITSSPPVALEVVRRVHPDATATEQATLTSVGRETLAYVCGRGSTLPAAYTPNEVAHLDDVRATITAAFETGALSAGFVVLLLGAAGSRRPVRVASALRVAGSICIALPVAVAVGLGFFFDPLFTLFHRVLYPQGNWLFPVDALLIITFPEDYWLTMGIVWMALIALIGVVFVLISQLYGKKRAQNVTNDANSGTIVEAKNPPV
jgi:integral membrane protein (TIGR01906 family)